MSTKGGKKTKKPLQTTLGKAPSQGDKEVDISQIRQPIHTNVCGLHQVLSLFQTATKEVQNYLINECDVIYECRICRTLFRSIANFVLHKRNFCKDKYGPLSLQQEEDLQSNSISVVSVDNHQENELTSGNTKTIERSHGGLSVIVQKLKDQQNIKELTKQVLSEDLSKEQESDGKEETPVDKTNKELLLEKIATNNAAVFQTVLQSMPNSCVKPEYIKSEIMEIHGILDNDEAVLGPDGKICNFTTKTNSSIPKQDLTCTECNMKFSTKKTLLYHVKYKHNNTRLVYVCPDCKDTFANAWCVYRHLFKIHRRTTSQIRRLREQIHNSVVRKDQEPLKKKEKKEIDNVDEENQWLNNIEGDKDFQMCGGCGKRFERKAALHSHAQMCQKRIAVCNTIKENNAKRKEEESKDKNKNIKLEKPCNTEAVKGASKRKPYLLRTYKPVDKIDSSTAISNESRNICDVNANSEIVNIDCDISSNVVNASNSCKIVNDSPVLKSGRLHKALSPIDDEQTYPDNCPSIDTEDVLGNVDIESTRHKNDIIRKELTCNLSSDLTHFNETVLSGKSSKTATSNSKKVEKNKDAQVSNFTSFYQKLAKHGFIGFERSSKKNSHNLTSEVKIEPKTEPQVSPNHLPPKSPSTISLSSLNDLLSPSRSDLSQATNKFSEKLLSEDIKEDDRSEENLSKTVKANVSPHVLRKVHRSPMKRKRTFSLDVSRHKKAVKLTNNITIFDKQDINFISKASPYMDQKNLLCIPCKIKYSTLPKLLWHMSSHFSWFRFQCSKCTFISFSKNDCTIHARLEHNTSLNEISSVVLPIPNWKTVLMSHEFSQLEEKPELSGRHTDENIVSCIDEPIVVDYVDSPDSPKNSEMEYVGKLFADCENIEIVEDNLIMPYPIVDHACVIKNESIDIVDEGKDSFQVDLPSEIYSPDLYETITFGDGTDDRTIRNVSTSIYVHDSDDLENEYYVPKKPDTAETNLKICDTGIQTTSTEKKESIVEAQIDYQVHIIERKNKPSTDTDPALDSIQKFRPKRNRTRSVKILQTDFVYDMSKGFKLNDTSVSKSNIQKQKKTNNAIQKTKPVPPNSKDTKESLRNK